jgi:hypothetical protein
MQCSKRVKSTLAARSPALAPRKEASTLLYFLTLSQAPGFRERRESAVLFLAPFAITLRVFTSN